MHYILVSNKINLTQSAIAKATAIVAKEQSHIVHFNHCANAHLFDGKVDTICLRVCKGFHFTRTTTNKYITYLINLPNRLFYIYGKVVFRHRRYFVPITSFAKYPILQNQINRIRKMIYLFGCLFFREAFFERFTYISAVDKWHDFIFNIRSTKPNGYVVIGNQIPWKTLYAIQEKNNIYFREIIDFWYFSKEHHIFPKSFSTGMVYLLNVLNTDPKATVSLLGFDHYQYIIEDANHSHVPDYEAKLITRLTAQGYNINYIN